MPDVIDFWFISNFFTRMTRLIPAAFVALMFNLSLLFGQGTQVSVQKDSITPATEIVVSLPGRDTVIVIPGDHLDPEVSTKVVPMTKVVPTPALPPLPAKGLETMPYRVTFSVATRAEADSIAKKLGGYVTEIAVERKVESHTDSLLSNGKGVIFFTPLDTPVKKVVSIPTPVQKQKPTTFMAIAQDGGDREVQPKIIPQTGEQPRRGYLVGKEVLLPTNEYPVGYELFPVSKDKGIFIGRTIYYSRQQADSLATARGMIPITFLHNPKQVWQTLPSQGTRCFRIQVLTVTSESYLVPEGVFFFEDKSSGKWYGYLVESFSDKSSANIALAKVREVYPDAYIRETRW